MPTSYPAAYMWGLAPSNSLGISPLGPIVLRETVVLSQLEVICLPQPIAIDCWCD